VIDARHQPLWRLLLEWAHPAPDPDTPRVLLLDVTAAQGWRTDLDRQLDGADPTADTRTPSRNLTRGIRIRRLRLLGPSQSFDVDFVGRSGDIRVLSVIAGATNTGKTRVLRFIAYVLGAKDFPAHP
jgi:hypothetical protein